MTKFLFVVTVFIHISNVEIVSFLGQQNKYCTIPYWFKERSLGGP